MSLIPRWRFMTDEAKAVAKRVALSVLVIVLALQVLRALLPLVLLLLLAWWVWRAFKR